MLTSGSEAVRPRWTISLLLAPSSHQMFQYRCTILSETQVPGGGGGVGGGAFTPRVSWSVTYRHSLSDIVPGGPAEVWWEL